MQPIGHHWRPLAAVCGLSLVLGSCANLRVFTTYEYKHLGSETSKKPTNKRTFMSGIFREGDRWLIRVMETRICEQQTVEVARETAKVRITAPTWYYFVGLGAVTSTLSTPFWVLGSRAANRTEATKHYLVGTLVFLVPGLAIVGIGTYYKLRAGTIRRDLGVRRRVKTRVEVPCKVAPAKGRTVLLGMRTGQKALGKTDGHGKIFLSPEGLRPLVRWSNGKVVKVYFDVQVENEPGQEVKVPKGFPVSPADLREPRSLQ